MSAQDYLEGALLLAIVLAATFGGAALLVAKRYGGLRGAERLVAGGVLATAGLLAVHLLPALLGILGRGSVLLAALLWLGACAFVPAADEGPPPAPPEPRRDEHARISWPLAVGLAALAAFFTATFVVSQAATPSSSADFMNFHLPSVIAWIRDGSLWSVESWLPAVAPGHYPNNGDAMVLVAVLPWHNDFLAHAAIWPFFALTGVATYALALRLGAGRSSALVAGALTLVIPVVAISALAHGITDSVMLFGFAAGLLFLLRHHRTGANADLVLAGLALGISFGTKWYGVSAVAIVVGVWAIGRLLARTPWRRVLAQTAAVTGLVALAGGIWLLRNWIESGNPVFPVEVAPLGVTLFEAPPDVTRELAGFTIADYLGDWDPWWKLEGNPELRGFVLDGILLQWWHALAAPALLAVVGGVAAAIVALRRRGIRAPRSSRGPVVAGIAMMALIVAVYAITPYTAGGPEDLPLLVGADSRYVVPALVLGLALGAWAAVRLPWGSVAFAALGIAAAIHGISWASKGELAPAELTTADWVGAVAIAGILLLTFWALEPWWGRMGAGGRSTALRAGAATALVAFIAGGYAVQRDFNDDRYLGADPVVDVVSAGEGRRIGLSSVWTDDGISPVLPAFGPRFENDVRYVGPVVDEMQQRYEDRDAFVAALERGGYDALVLGQGRREVGDPPEDEWARSAGWTLGGRSDRLDLYLPPAG